MIDPVHSKPLLGIGSCLAGNPVRYNGETKDPGQQVRALAEHFEMRPFCPEMGIGMGVPRPPIHLVGTTESVRALDVESHNNDFTDELASHADAVLSIAPDLCGYILVRGSPSCGYRRVKRFDMAGTLIATDQRGVFANALSDLDPLLPLEEDERLADKRLRDSFITRAYTYHDWKQLLRKGLTSQRLGAFYSRYIHLVEARHRPNYEMLGTMLTDASSADLEALSMKFITTLMTALQHHSAAA